LIGAALQANPTQPVYKSDGTFVQRNDLINGATVSSDSESTGTTNSDKDNENTTRILSNFGVTWKFARNFE